MIDLDYLEKIKLRGIPLGQRLMGSFFLLPNYHIFRKVKIEIENLEHIPRGENVIFAMNHTDRFNYWPFQFKLWRLKGFPYTTVWVKGKYYRNALLAKGLNWCNLIPVPSLGYFIEEYYRKKFRKPISRDLYRVIRDAVDDKRDDRDLWMKNLRETAAVMGEAFAEQLRSYYERVMEQVAQISISALVEKKLNLIIFPEGSRSLQLAEGRTGLAQLALHTGAKIVPVGCNNSDEIYPGGIPIAKSGRVTYRIGEPLSLDGALMPFRIPEPFKLLSKESQLLYREQFEEVTRLVMERINALLDEKYRQGTLATTAS